MEQVTSNITNYPFILFGKSFVRNAMTLLQDAGRSAVFAFGTLLAMIRVAVGSVTADVGNTGDGTVTLFVLAGGGSPIVGDYNFECIEAVTNGGIFKLEDPNGNLVASNLTLFAGAGETTDFIEGGLSFRVTDGTTDFIVGDKFAMTVAAVNKLVPFDATAVDGSQIPLYIYMGSELTAASIVAGDVTVYNILVGGCCTVAESQVVLEGSGQTLDTLLDTGLTVRETLSLRGIFAELTDNITFFEN